ncbi:ligase-associated DNA damage response endonuclease PdeM [Aquimarina intermedia]|uniref:Putative phosphoesterase n=1 Tax=Aquimarina intermedia TaxID=350814 RepID=A0A5S5CA43_9FLAO|nr:ligase-associated DNA damage response endonuclease PdeM [Aquimarina intermedia]TYP76177.1 putative phosphoesterase [Aquimarina intermedia]
MPDSHKILNNTFSFHPCGGLYWHETDMLLIADVHLGKVSHFRKHGSAVPQKAIQKNFDRLDAIIKQFDPAVITFMGDLFHSSLNNEWHLFEGWVAKHSNRKIILIAGNHDIISPLKYETLQIHISDEWAIGNFLLTHHPETREGFFNLCGHIHPGVKLQGLGRQVLKLPCYFKTADQMILPAFGEFTGLYVLNPEETDEVFALTKDDVIKVN